MKKILLLQTIMQPVGGGGAVTVWTIEALKQEHAISILTWTPVDIEALNRFYGTSLHESEFTAYRVHWLVRVLMKFVPAPDIPRKSILMRLCKRMKVNYDLVIANIDETDFGCRGIQYIHYPWLYKWQPLCESFVDTPWYHRLWNMMRGRYRSWMAVSRFSFDRMKKNLTLVNSDWTGNKCRELYGIEAITVYPPVPGVFPDVPWEQRENGFVCIGRIAREKRLEMLIDIVSAVRSQGQDVHLHLIGTAGSDLDYYNRVRQRVRENASWVFLNEHLSREDLIQLVSRHRYGIHGMPTEHFGIAVAEMVRGGCIVFVPNDGGQVEIVGGDGRLTYETAEAAMKKIVRVTRNPDEQAALRDYLSSRKGLFSTEHFIRRMQEIVQQL